MLLYESLETAYLGLEFSIRTDLPFAKISEIYIGLTSALGPGRSGSPTAPRGGCPGLGCRTNFGAKTDPLLAWSQTCDRELADKASGVSLNRRRF